MSKINGNLEGYLDKTPSLLSQVADDWGHMVHRPPLGVYRPESAEELADFIKAANRSKIKIAARGRGHSTLGQAQANGGVVVDMRALKQVLAINEQDVWVEAGATWREVLNATYVSGRTPPIFTDYIDLTIGGTLSVGGIGAQTYVAGLQSDNVLELELVTGNGDLVRCSSDDKPDLFDAVRAGAGQFAIITKARLAHVAALPMVRYVRTLYHDLPTFLSDQFALAEAGVFDGLQGFALPNSPEGVAQATGNAFPDMSFPVSDGAWLFMLEGAKYGTVEAMPDTATLLSGLSHLPNALSVLDIPYTAYISRLDLVEAALRDAGLWDMPHPWIDVFVPREKASDYITYELTQITPADVVGAILIYPYRRASINTPNFPLPDSDQFVLFALLRTALPPTPERVSQLMQANSQLYTRCLQAGGTGYAIDAIPLTPQAWQQHFGERWPELAAAKKVYDPYHLLAPGQYVFSP